MELTVKEVTVLMDMAEELVKCKQTGSERYEQHQKFNSIINILFHAGEHEKILEVFDLWEDFEVDKPGDGPEISLDLRVKYLVLHGERDDAYNTLYDLFGLEDNGHRLALDYASLVLMHFESCPEIKKKFASHFSIDRSDLDCLASKDAALADKVFAYLTLGRNDGLNM
jgi:pentatricopeptide repeat protein